MAEPRVVRTDVPLEVAGELLRQAMAGLDRPRLAVSGGSAGEVLGLVRRALGAQWRQVRLTWVDERRVAFADPDSNRGTAYRRGYLDPADPPALELPLYLDGEAGDEASRRVEASLDRDFAGGLDLLLLGLGEDGHSASLAPGRPWTRARVHAVEGFPKPPPSRMTLGLAFMATARVAVLVAFGSAKATALERLSRGDPALPASALRGLTVVTDLDAHAPEGAQGEHDDNPV